MKKRIIAFALLAVILISSLLMPTYAMRSPVKRIEGVDYNRIKRSEYFTKEVKLKIGDKVFSGNLTLVKSISEDEEDAVIKQVMKEMNITTGNLLFARHLIQKVEKAKGFDVEFVKQLGIKFAMGATGIDNIADVYAVVMGEEEASSVAVNTVIGEAISSASEKVFTRTIGFLASAAVSGLYNCTELAGQKVAALMRESEEAELAVEKSIMLDLFYYNCFLALEKAEREKGSGVWEIKFNDTVSADATLFEIPVKQFWRVSGELKRVDIYGNDKDFANFGGIYRGDLQIEIWHDLSNFDNEFQNVAVPNFSITNYLKGSGFKTSKRDKNSSVLTKQLNNTETVEVHLDMRNMTSRGMTEKISLKGFNDVSNFNVDHTIRQAHPSDLWNTDGHLDVTVSGGGRIFGDFYLDWSYAGQLEYGNRYPVLTVKGLKAFGDMSVTAPMFSQYVKSIDSDEKVELNFIADYQVFDDLRNGYAELTVKD